MHSPRKTYLLLALLPLALANIVSQISDGQIQEPAEQPAAAAPKIAIAPTSSAPAAAPPPPPPPPTSTSTSIFTPPPKPSSTPPPALQEAGATAAPPKANTSIPAPAPAPANLEEAAAVTTAPILIAPAPAPAPASNTTVPPHHAAHEAPHPSASSVGMILPAENGTAPTVPVVPAIANPAPTSAEGSPREAGTTRAVAAGGAGRVAAGGGVWAVVGVVAGLAVVVVMG